MIRNLFDEFCEKHKCPREKAKSLIEDLKATYNYSKHSAIDIDDSCVNCQHLKFCDYDDITFEKVLQCEMMYEMYGTHYCHDELKHCACNKFRAKIIA